MKELPFSYVKEHEVFFEHTGTDHTYLFRTSNTPVEVLLEIYRLNPEMQFELIELGTSELLSKAEQAFSQSDETVDLDLIAFDDVYFDQILEQIPEQQDLLEQVHSAPVIKLINGLFAEALKNKASDIHIETYETSVSVRIRLDGVLKEIFRPDRRLAPLIISRIKVMAKLDIAEKRIPQDGRIALKIAGRSIDIRVSTLPTSYGERVVLRILDKTNTQLDLQYLGIPVSIEQTLTSLLSQPNGIVLVTGPTGSGKTTTLYAGLTQLNDKCRNILTVEDPVEYELDGIGQTQVNLKTGMGFAEGLRAMLRQDPDVVMVGEIRDIETAEIAVQASLTGHLVLSTLHTNDAPSAITRLVDIGIEPFLISSSLRGVLAQRLVRKLCHNCKAPVRYSKNQLNQFNFPVTKDINGFEAKGCSACNGTGYQGRLGVYELLVINESVREILHAQKPEKELRVLLESEGATLESQAVNLINQGISDLTEVLRTVRSI